MAKLTNTTIYGSANITGTVVATGPAFDISANSGINISSANTISLVTLSTAGSYSGASGFPSVTFANTTTGGVTANANVLMKLAGTLAIQNVGYGYANGDMLFANTGTYLQPAQIQVTSNTATTYGTGGINGFNIISYGLYFSPPNANVYGGIPYITFANTTGSGVAANVSAGSSYTVNNVYFSNYGSGYVEQPTVTFSGGSPSSAAVGYATVGGSVTIKSIGNELVLQQTGDTYGTTSLRIQNRAGQNGPLFDASLASLPLVDFGFKTVNAQRNIRFETRTGQYKFITAGDGYEFQIGSAGNPTLVTSNTGILVYANTISTSNLTGALLVNGGAGITGNVYTGNHVITGSGNGITFVDGTIQTTAGSSVANTVYLQGALATANANTVFLLGALATANANTVFLTGIENSQNANIITVQALANTDYTLISIPSVTTSSNGLYVPIITVSANGRVTSITNTAIAITGGGSSSGYLANSVIFANGTGYLANTANIQFFGSNNTLVVANISVPTIYTTLGGIVFPDGTTQATSASGSATDTAARTLAQAAYNQANLTSGGLTTANANTVFLSGALATTNANTIFITGGLNTANANISFLFGIELTQNANISSAFAQANSAGANTVYIIGGLNTANANTVFLSGALATANANTVFLTGALATTNANTIFTQGGLNTANANTVYTQGVDVTQNTWISSNQAFTQAAFTAANVGNTFVNTGGTVNGTITITGGLNVSGNINVSGSLVTYSSNSINVQDPIIYLAANNSANVVDIGIVGHFIGGQWNNYQHTGIIRNHLNANWSFFSNVSTEPSATINFAEANLVYDSITAGGYNVNGRELYTYTSYLQGGLNTANANTVYITGGLATANANTVFLTGALATTNANTIFTQGVDVTQNTWISSNQAFTQASFAQANLTAGGLVTANANTIFLSGALATTNANTVFLSGVNSTQNTWISSNSLYSQAAFAQANSAGANTVYITGGLATANANTVFLTGALATANANTIYLQGALNSANANTIFLSGALNSANANIIAVQALANTDYTFVSSPTGTFGSSTLVPVVTVAANGRITNITTTAVSGGGGSSSNSFSTILVSGQPNVIANTATSPLTLVAGSGINITTVGTSNTITISSTGGFSGGTIANQLIVANTLSSYSNSNNALQVSGGVGVANSVYVGNRVGFGNTTQSFAYTTYNSTFNSIDTIFG